MDHGKDDDQNRVSFLSPFKVPASPSLQSGKVRKSAVEDADLSATQHGSFATPGDGKNCPAADSLATASTSSPASKVLRPETPADLQPRVRRPLYPSSPSIDGKATRSIQSPLMFRKRKFRSVGQELFGSPDLKSSNASTPPRLPYVTLPESSQPDSPLEVAAASETARWHLLQCDEILTPSPSSRCFPEARGEATPVPEEGLPPVARRGLLKPMALSERIGTNDLRDLRTHSKGQRLRDRRQQPEEYQDCDTLTDGSTLVNECEDGSKAREKVAVSAHRTEIEGMPSVTKSNDGPSTSQKVVSASWLDRQAEWQNDSVYLGMEVMGCEHQYTEDHFRRFLLRTSTSKKD